MYSFFMISGYFFVVGASVILQYLFEIFSINIVTKFLSPTEDTIFNKIGIIMIPNILWALIEIVLLGNNYYFILGFLLNIFVSLCLMYVVRYGYTLISKYDSNIVNVVSIFFACFFGFLCNYLCLMIGVNRNINPLYSILGLLIFIIIYVLIRLFPPKSKFFRGKFMD